MILVRTADYFILKFDLKKSSPYYNKAELINNG